MPLNGASCFLSRVRKCNRSPTVAPAASRLLRAGPSDFDSPVCVKIGACVPFGLGWAGTEAEVKPAQRKVSHDLSALGGQQIVSTPDPEISTKGTTWLS